MQIWLWYVWGVTTRHILKHCFKRPDKHFLSSFPWHISFPFGVISLAF